MSDYVVIRKRRRTYTQAIDPCLGYYLHAQSDAGTKASDTTPSPKVLASVQVEKWRDKTQTIVPTSFDGERELEIPSSKLSAPGHPDVVPGKRHPLVSATGENNPPVSEHTSMLSVEEFLKRSSDSDRNPPLNLRRYRGKRRAGRLVLHSPEESNRTCGDSRRITRRDPCSDSGFEPSSDLVTSSPRDRSASSGSMLEPGKIFRPKKKYRQRKNLKERLYEAAVSTYGYPDPNFMDNLAAKLEDTENPQWHVKPLRFVPGSGIQLERTSPPKRQNRRKFVDPRKSNAIRTASFSSKLRTARVASHSDAAVLMNVLDRLPAEKWILDLDHEENPAANRDLRLKSNLKRKHTKDSSSTNWQAGRNSECPPLTFVDLKQAEAAYANVFSLQRTRAEGGKKASPTQQFTPLAPALELIAWKDSRKGANSGIAIVPIFSSENHPMPTNYRSPGLQMTNLTDRITDDSNIDVASHRLPSECAPREFLYSPVQTMPFYDSDVAAPFPRNEPSNASRTNHPEDCSSRETETLNHTKLTRNNKPLRPLVSFMDEFFENIRNVKASEGADAGTESRVKRGKNRPRSSLKGSSPGLYREIKHQMPAFQRSPSPNILTALQSQSYQVLLTLEDA